jgi:hypothetical protein
MRPALEMNFVTSSAGAIAKWRKGNEPLWRKDNQRKSLPSTLRGLAFHGQRRKFKSLSDRAGQIEPEC